VRVPAAGLGAAFGGLRAALLAALGGLAALGQTPWGLWPLTLLALAAALVLIPGGRARRAFGAVWLFGLGYFALAMHWIVEPFWVDPDRHGWMAPFALVLMAGGLALFWALGAALAVRAIPGRLGLALGLIAAEIARSLVLTGLPWALLGHVWLDTPLAQLGAWVGPFGLTALTLLAPALVVIRPRLAGPGVVALGGLAWALMAPGPAGDPASDGPLIRIVQPNIDQAEKWDPALIPGHVGNLIRLSGGVQVPALVVWPETALPMLLDEALPILATASAGAGGAPIASGAVRVEGQRYFNTLVLTDRAGEVLARHDKAHLTPFGEYIPFGGWLNLFGLSGLDPESGGGFSAGPGLAPLAIPGIGEMLPLICYEGIFAEEVRPAASGVQALLLVTNDAWFGQNAGPAQHLAQARFRAIELGLPVIRAANTGISAMIDARGRVLRSLPLGVAGAIDMALPAALPPTPYGRFGDWPVVLALLVLALVARRLDPAPLRA
jgi:apolipoprotein N-acyltransferase